MLQTLCQSFILKIENNRKNSLKANKGKLNEKCTGAGGQTSKRAEPDIYFCTNVIGYNITSQDQSSGIVLQQRSGAQHAPGNNKFYASAQNKSCYAKHADSFWLRLVGLCLVNSFFFLCKHQGLTKHTASVYVLQKESHTSNPSQNIMKSLEIWRRRWRVKAERRHWTQLIVLCGTIQPRLPIVSPHSRHSRNKKEDLGGLSLFWKNETNTFHYLRSSCHSVPFRERQIAEAFVVFVSVSKCRQKGRAGQGKSMITTFLTTPPHPVQCDGTGAARWQVLGDSKISLLCSLLAVSTRLIQCVTASPYLHTNKREDVDSYRCPPLRMPACLWLLASFLSPSFP